MYLTQKHISRRTVLKGVGATIALPLLDAMSPAATVWASTAAGSAPKRFAFVGFPHGAIMDHWSPAQTGSDYQMSPILTPLEPFRQHMTIISGLRNKPGETPEPHAYIESTWLSCVKPWRSRCRWSGGRHHRRPDGGPAYRAGHAAAIAGADDVASRSAVGVADADPTAAAGRQSARGVSKAVRPGRYRQGTCGDSARNRQHSRPRQGTSRPPADQPGRSRPASSSATTSIRCARSSGACRWRRSRTRHRWTFPMRRLARRTTSPSISS